jgi:hypothetical protein
MSTITVTWKAFNNNDPKRLQDFADQGRNPVTSRTIEVDDTLGMSHSYICEMLFRDTNTYQGPLWDALQPLPRERTHTAMSVGDEVIINKITYRCADFGFEEVE